MKAGFGRADITPPSGLGLAGYGPAGGAARGHRHRLYARAMILEDADGERIAWVALDLGQPSVMLHREVAWRIVTSTGIGADRLVLTATHTHSGPGHFFSSRAYNQYGQGVHGFDPAVVTFLADRIAAAIREAAAGMTRAVASWRQAEVWGFTANRSYTAFIRNPPAEDRPVPPRALRPEQAAVDPTWTMLRVDTVSLRGDTVPAGALSVFAFHPTGNPPANDLYDGDVPSLVERGLERHMDELADAAPPFEPASVHLVANGSEGDVVLDGSLDHPCERPVQRPGTRPGGPHTPRPLDEWRSDTWAPGSACVSLARAFINQVGDSLIARAVKIYESPGQTLRDDVRIRRAFRTVDLTNRGAQEGLCDQPMIGTGAAAGSEGSQSNLKDWKVLGLFPLHATEGSTDSHASGCHAPKRQVPWVLRFGMGELHLPTTLQLTVLQIGDMLVATVPVELTTEAGFRLRDAMLEAARRTNRDVRAAVPVSLANGYMQYASTREEYRAQHYEGGSTLYGPGFTEFLQREVGTLVEELAGGGSAEVEPVVVYPGNPRQVFPASRHAAPDHLVVRRTYCASDTVVVRWIDAPAGTLLPSDGPIIRLTRWAEGRETVAWDDDRFVEIRVLEPSGGSTQLWEARWTPPGGSRGDYSIAWLRWAAGESRRGFTCP